MNGTFCLKVDHSIELRLLEERHADELFAIVNANREYLREWLPWLDTAERAADTKDFIRQSLERYSKNDGLHAGIWFRQELVGAIGLHYVDSANRTTSIGYWIAAPAQGNGVVTASCRALLDYAFDDLQMNRVEIRVAPRNHRSRKIPERLGFTHEATLREAEWLYDHFVDLEIHSMLASQWKIRS